MRTFTLAQVLEITRVINPFATETQILAEVDRLFPESTEPAPAAPTPTETETAEVAAPASTPAPEAPQPEKPAEDKPNLAEAYDALWAVVNRKGEKQLAVDESGETTTISTLKGQSARKASGLRKKIETAIAQLGGVWVDGVAQVPTQTLKSARKCAKVAARAAKRNKK